MDPEITIDKRLVEIKPGSFIFEFPNALSTEICKDIIDTIKGVLGKTLMKINQLKFLQIWL